MEKRGLTTIALVSLMLFSVFAVAPVSAELVCPPGMVSYWKFDEGSGTIAYDSVNENQGLIHGATWTTGRVDAALSLDGVDDYIEVADSPSLDITDAITLEAWIRPQEHTYIGWVISKGKAYHLGLDTDSYVNHVRFELQTSETSSIYTRSDGTVNLNEWNHIAVTVDSAALIFYINGIRDREILGRSVYGVSDYNLGIGASVYYGVGAFFNGIIDEVAIYNRSLLPEEIQQHYENGLSGLGYCEVTPTVSISADEFEYSPGDPMAITIDIANPIEDSVTFQWFWLVPQFSVCVPVMSVPIPAGYDDTFDFSFSIPDWGLTPFGNVFYVQLLDASGEVLDADCACWTYSPGGRAVIPSAKVNIEEEIINVIERVELPS